ncbi:MAG: YihA family ribosome biogenesis GTP-binding protein [Clostridia bacterium]|nr:YihA family ribosome biogenesis GTP-binding protein [Clostridia bacterium]
MKLNLNRADLKMSAGNLRQFPSDVRPQIAFSGRSNVGKSSLLNTLLGRKSLARVSSSPGKTLTVNFYDIDGKIYFVDLPGYGFAKRSADTKSSFSEVTDAYFTKNPMRDQISLILQLVDVRIGPTDDDKMMISYLESTGLPFLVVATKADKLSKTATEQAIEAIKAALPELPDLTVIPFSSVSRIGKEEVWKEIYKVLP